MRVLSNKCVVFGVTHVGTAVTVDSTLPAFTIEFFSVLDTLRVRFVLLVVLQLMPLGFGTDRVFE
tara:strand:- start:170 stop:364 length:195 start_codon:yes stop_codon:yes gene_type:complete